MKTQIFYSIAGLLLLLSNSLLAQNTLPSGTFENWERGTIWRLDGFNSLNFQAQLLFDRPNAERSDEARSGDHALKLSTLLNE